MAPKPTYEELEQTVRELEQEAVLRRQAEQALQESENSYRTLAENLPSIVYRISIREKNRMQFFNHMLYPLTGYQPAELARGDGCAIDALIVPADRAEVMRTIKEAVAQNKPFEVEYRLAKKNGDIGYCLERGRPIRGNDGRPAYIDGVILDITARKKAEDLLQRQNKYLAALHETALGLIGRLDLNELLKTILQRAAELAQTPEGFFNLYDSQNNYLEVKVGYGTLDKAVGFRYRPGEGLTGKVWQTGKPLVIQDYRKWPERLPNPAFDNLVAIVGLPLACRGHTAGVIGLAHTQPGRRIGSEEVKILEMFAELASIALDNAQLYTQMQNELQKRRRIEKERLKMEARLRKAQKMEALGTLAGGIAHDFNNLLMGIQGRASLMLMDMDSNHPEYEHLRGIEEHVKSASDLTRQLLGFARAGKYEVKPTDLNQAVEKTAQMFGRTKKEIKIHRQYQEGIWPVEVDQGQIEQVLLNLYVNAWQAMPAGGDLHLATQNIQLDPTYVKPLALVPGNYVKISVTDTGVGMDKKTRERVFDPFFTTKKRGRGTGLGLASAYGIIHNHGGIINVYSEKGHGATFTVYLPAAARAIHVEAPALSQGLMTGSETVLLVDDEQIILEVGEKLLAKLGYRVLAARNGREALEVYARNKENIALVILDMIMPEMSGSDTYDNLKAMDPHVKTLLSSGYSVNGQATEILQRGCDGFIQKPFDIKRIARKVREILDKPG
ncbi:MAG: response regulator [Desulfobacterales bacterium]|nr:MAG: response regulator [Desulfobacterales bacterium]